MRPLGRTVLPPPETVLTEAGAADFSGGAAGVAPGPGWLVDDAPLLCTFEVDWGSDAARI